MKNHLLNESSLVLTEGEIENVYDLDSMLVVNEGNHGCPEDSVVVLKENVNGEDKYLISEYSTAMVMDYYPGISEYDAFKKIIESNNIIEDSAYLLIETLERDTSLLFNLNSALSKASGSRKSILEDRIRFVKKRISERKEKMKLASKK